MSKIQRVFELLAFKVSQRLHGAPVSDSPWFDDATLAWFTARLPQAQSYIEFGSGGSTVMAAKLGIPTISVEGDHFFASQVAKKIGNNHSVKLLRPPIGMTGLWGVPVPGTPTPERVARWSAYIDMPFAELQRAKQPFPDLFLVDGRFRAACALRAALETSRVGKEADLLFDDYERDNHDYSVIEQLLPPPQRIGRSAVFKLTANTKVTESDVFRAMHDFH